MVSIHAPARGATGKTLVIVRHDVVSIHAPARGATSLSIYTPTIIPFQSTRPQGARPGSPSSSYRVKSFQSTRPQGARPVMTTAHTMQGLFQSTRPQGARRRRAGDAGHRRQVSIHAPARGATGVARLRHKWIVVSIHAPARGATGLKWGRHFFHTSFNPRARKGRDQSEFTNATGLFVFQSTRPQGARRLSLATFTPGAMFQSTRPQGARLPRPPKIDGNSLVSIHAPARGATSLSSGKNT